MYKIAKILVIGISLTFLLIVGVIFGLTSVALGAPTVLPPTVEPVVAAVPATPEPDPVIQMAEFEASLQERDAAFLDQINAAEQSLKERDSIFQSQLQETMDQIAAQQQALADEQGKLEAAQAKVVDLSTAISSKDKAFKAEMKNKADQLATNESQMQNEITQVYAQLQADYDQIAAGQQQVVAASGGGGGSGDHSSSKKSSKHKDDEHEDDD